MDPNEALAKMRRLLAYKAEMDPTDNYVFVETFEALDKWLDKGGFLPNEWAKATDARGPNEPARMPSPDQVLVATLAATILAGIAAEPVWPPATHHGQVHSQPNGLDRYQDNGVQLATRIARDLIRAAKEPT